MEREERPLFRSPFTLFFVPLSVSFHGSLMGRTWLNDFALGGRKPKRGESRVGERPSIQKRGRIQLTVPLKRSSRDFRRGGPTKCFRIGAATHARKEERERERDMLPG